MIVSDRTKALYNAAIIINSIIGIFSAKVKELQMCTDIEVNDEFDLVD